MRRKINKATKRFKNRNQRRAIGDISGRRKFPIGSLGLGAELFGVGIDCYLPNGQGYSLECTQQSTSNINDGCNHEVQDCEDNFGGSATLVVA